MRTCEKCSEATIKDDAPTYVKLCLTCYKDKASKKEPAASVAVYGERNSRKDDQIARMNALSNAVKLAELYVTTKQWKEVDVADVYALAQQLKDFVDTGATTAKK